MRVQLDIKWPLKLLKTSLRTSTKGCWKSSFSGKSLSLRRVLADPEKTISILLMLSNGMNTYAPSWKSWITASLTYVRNILSSKISELPENLNEMDQIVDQKDLILSS